MSYCTLKQKGSEFVSLILPGFENYQMTETQLLFATVYSRS